MSDREQRSGENLLRKFAQRADLVEETQHSFYTLAQKLSGGSSWVLLVAIVHKLPFVVAKGIPVGWRGSGGQRNDCA